MYVLTSIYGNGTKAKVWDSEDGSTDEVDFISLARRITTTDIRVFGIQRYSPDASYPPDYKPQPALGIVIIPSEALEAVENFGKK